MVGNLPISDRRLQHKRSSFLVQSPGAASPNWTASGCFSPPQVHPYFSSASLVVWGGHQDSAPRMTQNTNLSLVDCQPHSHTFRCVEELRIVTLTQVRQMVHNLVVQHVDLNMVRPCKAESTRRLTYICIWI